MASNVLMCLTLQTESLISEAFLKHKCLTGEVVNSLVCHSEGWCSDPAGGTAVIQCRSGYPGSSGAGGRKVCQV